MLRTMMPCLLFVWLLSQYGLAAEDAGLATEDVGLTAEDVGLTAEDAGPTAEDVGPTAEDTGPTAEDAGQAAAEKKEAVKTTEVEPGPFRVDVEIEGTFVAEKMTEIAVYPKEWSSFTVIEAASHGQVVHEGEVLVRFDGTDLAAAIADMEANQRLAELAIIQAERELPQFERSLALALESAERSGRYAAEDLQRYLEIDRPLSQKSAEQNLKSSRHYLEYAQEELKQLQKMYDADDLTEETEEIILKRQQHAVESAQFSLERGKINYDETLKVMLPRRDASTKDAVEQAKLALDQAKIGMELKVNQKRFELQKAKHDRSRSLEKHAKLLADQEWMVVKADEDGVVYYGQCVDGAWPKIGAMKQSLRPKGNVGAKSVFMTIVGPRPLSVHGKIAEKDLAGFREGLAARIEPTANREALIEGRVKRTSAVPVEDGQFSVELGLGTEGAPDWIVAGMTCKVTMTTYQKDDALTVPEKAVQTDKGDPTKKYVNVLGDDDKPRRQPVQLGRKSGDVVEIIEGLSPGDRVATKAIEE